MAWRQKARQTRHVAQESRSEGGHNGGEQRVALPERKTRNCAPDDLPPAVRRNNRPPRHVDDGRRVWFRAMGEVLGYPRLEFDPGRAILPGRESWRKFADRASTADIALAVAVLLTVDATGRTAGSEAPGGREVDSPDG